MTEPKDLPYTISGREQVARIDGMRVQILSLAPDDTVPWHYHSTVHDIFICLAGTTIVRTQSPVTQHFLAPGDHCIVAPGAAHEVSATGKKGCRFCLVQGIGAHDYHEVDHA